MITAIIPARSGSRRFPNKNISKITLDYNLLQYKIKQLKNVKRLDDIVVSSDSDFYLQIAKEMGVSVHKRPIEYADEKTYTFGQCVEKICSDIKCDDVLWATCTSPLINVYTYEKSIELYYSNVPNNNDSLVSFEPFKRYIWDDNGPLNYKLGIHHVPSQELQQLYYVTDGICIAPRIKMIEWKYFHGKNPYKLLLDKIQSLDIDDEIDFKICKSILKNIEIFK